MKYIVSLKFIFFISIIFSPYKYSQVKYINQFEKDRWSTLEIYSAWDICRNVVNKWEWSNEKISRYHCSCLMDWQRTVIHEIGVNVYDASKDFDKGLIKEKAKVCFEHAKNSQDIPFGQGGHPSDEEPNRLGTSSIITTFSGCVAKNKATNQRYKYAFCGCLTDKLREIFTKYGRKKTLVSINNQKGDLWERYVSSEKTCQSYSMELTINEDKRKHELKKVIANDMGKIYGYMTFENSFEKKGCYKKTGRKKKILNIFQLLLKGMPDDFSKEFNSYYAKHSNQKQLNADKIVFTNFDKLINSGKSQRESCQILFKRIQSVYNLEEDMKKLNIKKREYIDLFK